MADTKIETKKPKQAKGDAPKGGAPKQAAPKGEAKAKAAAKDGGEPKAKAPRQPSDYKARLRGKYDQEIRPQLREKFAVGDRVLVAGKTFAIEVVDSAPELSTEEISAVVKGW